MLNNIDQKNALEKKGALFQKMVKYYMKMRVCKGWAGMLSVSNYFVDILISISFQKYNENSSHNFLSKYVNGQQWLGKHFIFCTCFPNYCYAINQLVLINVAVQNSSQSYTHSNISNMSFKTTFENVVSSILIFSTPQEKVEEFM